MPLGVEERFDALKSGKIDVLSHNSTWTMSREIDFGLAFVGVNYYDGQAFLVPKSPRADFRVGTRRRQGLRAVRERPDRNFDDFFKATI